MFTIKGNIFQYVNTEDNADIVINTGNPWNASIYPSPDFSGGFASPPKTKVAAWVVDLAIASRTLLNPKNIVDIAGILKRVIAKKKLKKQAGYNCFNIYIFFIIT